MKNYFSASELENLHLATLPSCKRLINIKAKKENWPFRSRKGRGGGKEYMKKEMTGYIVPFSEIYCNNVCCLPLLKTR